MTRKDHFIAEEVLAKVLEARKTYTLAMHEKEFDLRSEKSAAGWSLLMGAEKGLDVLLGKEA